MGFFPNDFKDNLHFHNWTKSGSKDYWTWMRRKRRSDLSEFLAEHSVLYRLFDALSSALGVRANVIIGKLMQNGIMANINQSLEDDVGMLMAEELGIKVTLKQPRDITEELLSRHEEEDKPEELVLRALGTECSGRFAEQSEPGIEIGGAIIRVHHADELAVRRQHEVDLLVHGGQLAIEHEHREDRRACRDVALPGKPHRRRRPTPPGSPPSQG